MRGSVEHIAIRRRIKNISLQGQPDREAMYAFCCYKLYMRTVPNSPIRYLGEN